MMQGAAMLAALVSFAVGAHATALPSPAELLAAVPGAASFTHELAPIDYYTMKDARGKVVGAAFVTSSIPPAVSGYGGEIDVLAGIDTAGQITGIKVLSHHETPAIWKRVLEHGFLDRFKGRRVDATSPAVETVSGATISTQAIVDDVRTASTAVLAALGGQAAAAGVTASRGSSIPWAPAAAVLGMAGLAIATTLMPRQRWLRWMTLFSSVGVIGFWLNTPITIGDLIDARNVDIAWTAKLPLVLLMAFAVIAALWRGNLYCSSLCPFGALQVGAARAMPLKCCPDERAQRGFAWLRWLVAIATVYAIAAMGSYAFRIIEPFALCFSRNPERITLIQTGVVLAAALVVRRVWCRFFCPTGLVMDLVALVGSKLRHGVSRMWRRQHGS